MHVGRGGGGERSLRGVVIGPHGAGNGGAGRDGARSPDLGGDRVVPHVAPVARGAAERTGPGIVGGGAVRNATRADRANASGEIVKAVERSRHNGARDCGVAPQRAAPQMIERSGPRYQ